jgi:hypothetical protein
MSGIREDVLLGYSQLPKNYAVHLSDTVETKIEILQQKLLNAISSGEPNILYVDGTAEPIYKMLKNEYTLSDMWGIDFIEYFNSTFNKDGEDYKVNHRKFVFIYNVGLERAINTAFSSRLLKALIKDLRDRGCWIFIESVLQYQKFTTQYDMEITNRTTLKVKKEKSFL